MRSCLPAQAGSIPCEVWPFIYSSVARVEVSQRIVQKLDQQLEAALANGSDAHCSNGLRGEVRQGREVFLEDLDQEFHGLLMETCRLLAWSLLGTNAFKCELDCAWGVVQRAGDYSAMQSQRNKKSPFGLSAVMDIRMPPQLSVENHDRPSKGSYGYHDGIRNFLWKGDKTTDREDLVQPGIILCELANGFLFVYPQWLQSLTWPFDGESERRWIGANVALLDIEPEVEMNGRSRLPLGALMAGRV